MLQGDSGVGLIGHDGVVVGVASLVKECGQGPGLYTDVMYYTNFIQNFRTVHFRSEDLTNSAEKMVIPHMFAVVVQVMFVRFYVNLIIF